MTNPRASSLYPGSHLKSQSSFSFASLSLSHTWPLPPSANSSNTGDEPGIIRCQEHGGSCDFVRLSHTIATFPFSLFIFFSTVTTRRCTASLATPTKVQAVLGAHKGNSFAAKSGALDHIAESADPDDCQLDSSDRPQHHYFSAH